MPVYTPEKPDFTLFCPDFSLPAVDSGKTLARANFQNGNPFLVMFICNHCPYVKAIEDRLIVLGTDLKKENMNVVAICSNDENSYPDDSLVNLKKRMLEKRYSFYYLYDQTQSAAKNFGAVCTPDFFVYDHLGKLSYRGRLDDSSKDPNLVTSRELYNAMLELAAKKPISKPQTVSAGCSIKWVK